MKTWHLTITGIGMFSMSFRCAETTPFVDVMTDSSVFVSSLWSIYTGFIGVATVLSLFGIFSTSYFDAILVVIGVLGFVGLYGFVSKRDIYVKPFWVVVFVLNVFSFLYSVASFESNRWENDLPITTYGYLFLFLPQLYALYKYANIRLG